MDPPRPGVFLPNNGLIPSTRTSTEGVTHSQLNAFANRSAGPSGVPSLPPAPQLATQLSPHGSQTSTSPAPMTPTLDLTSPHSILNPPGQGGTTTTTDTDASISHPTTHNPKRTQSPSSTNMAARTSGHSPADNNISDNDQQSRKRFRASPDGFHSTIDNLSTDAVSFNPSTAKRSKSECRLRHLSYENHPVETGPWKANPHATYGTVTPLSFTKANLPSIDLQLEAIDVFLLHKYVSIDYDTFYFIHKPTLVDSVKDGTAPKELLFCILAFAARFMPSLKELHQTPTTNAPDAYAAAAASSLATSTTSPAVRSNGLAHSALDAQVTLIRCQCFLMLGVFECTAGLENAGWLRIGQAFRMCQILRLGFEDEDEGTTTSSTTKRTEKDPIRSEMRRRTFWSCFLIDRTMSDGKERPCVLRVPLPSVLRLPGSDAYYHTSTYVPGARFDPNPPPWSLPHHGETVDKDPEPDLYGMTLRVSQVFQKISTYIGAGGRNVDRRPPWQTESTFATLRSQLLQFEQSLPKDFEYNDSNFTAHCLIGQGRLYAMLHLLYNTATLILHRDYLPFLPPPNFKPTDSYWIGVCLVGCKAGDGPIDGEPLYGDATSPSDWWQASFNCAAVAAGNVADILSMSISHGSMISHPFAGFAALASTTIHLHLKYWPQSSDAPVNNAFHIEQTAATLTSLRDVYPIAAGWCDGMAKLQVLYFGRVRGKIDIDPAKVRSSVVKLLRSSRDDDHTPSSTTTTRALGKQVENSTSGSTFAGRNTSTTATTMNDEDKQVLNAAAELSPGEHIVSHSSLAHVLASPAALHSTTPTGITSLSQQQPHQQVHSITLPSRTTTTPGGGGINSEQDSPTATLDFDLLSGLTSQPYHNLDWNNVNLDPLIDLFGSNSTTNAGWADFNLFATMDPFGSAAGSVFNQQQLQQQQHQQHQQQHQGQSTAASVATTSHSGQVWPSNSGQTQFQWQ
ncbi:hypothetical protein OIO90_000317 [Microbotryomycetes sp. JL221]|nr:hypothetical protein OIO90_000317 [Microbotryomycetes sp. JL221]